MLGVLKVGLVITSYHRVIKILISCVLQVEHNNVAMMLDAIIVGHGHQRNGLRYKIIMVS